MATFNSFLFVSLPGRVSWLNYVGEVLGFVDISWLLDGIGHQQILFLGAASGCFLIGWGFTMW